jgi:hypothetical protein
MNHNYKIRKFLILEINNKNSKFYAWNFSDLVKENPSTRGIMYNMKNMFDGDENKIISSFIRTKKWAIENHPELLI